VVRPIVHLYAYPCLPSAYRGSSQKLGAQWDRMQGLVSGKACNPRGEQIDEGCENRWVGYPTSAFPFMPRCSINLV
jgi:hypothetical protein